MTTEAARTPAADAASADRAASGALADSPGTGAAVRQAVLPAQCGAADAALRAVLDVVDGADGWDAATRRAMLAWVGKHRDLVAVVEAKVLTAERDAGTWGLRGDRDLAGFVGRTSRSGRGAGLAAVGQAGTLAAMPVVAEALVDGPVTVTHVQQITRATAGSPVLAAELGSPAGQAELVALAGRLDGGEFGRALAQLSASLDPASRQRAHDEQRASRSFAWTHTPSGTLVKGRLDSVAGHTLAKAIDALCPRPTVDDDRSREMRQADALLALVERAAADKTTTPGAVAPVQAILTLTQDTWTALRASHDDPDGSPAGSAVEVIGRLRAVPAVTDETGQAWPASEIARALCDCALTRAVTGTPDVELNLGRESRAFTRRHWLALYAAGITGCQIPSCGMPLAYCQLHHIAWWQRDGGQTNQANCAAYCSYHHHQIHRLGIVVTRRANGTLEHRHPDGRSYGASTGRPADDDIAHPVPEPVADACPAAERVTAGGEATSGDPPPASPPGAGPPSAPIATAGHSHADVDDGGPPASLLDLLSA